MHLEASVGRINASLNVLLGLASSDHCRPLVGFRILQGDRACCVVVRTIGQDQAPAQLALESVNGYRVNFRARGCKPCSTPCAKDECPCQLRGPRDKNAYSAWFPSCAWLWVSLFVQPGCVQLCHQALNNRHPPPVSPSPMSLAKQSDGCYG